MAVSLVAMTQYLNVTDVRQTLHDCVDRIYAQHRGTKILKSHLQPMMTDDWMNELA